MTTGTANSTSWITEDNFRYVDYRHWSGGDGKYTVVNGFEALKHNPYFLEIVKKRGIRVPNPPTYPAGNFVDIGSSFNVGLANLTANDTNHLLAKLFSKVKGHELQLAVCAAEGAKTIKLVKNSILTVGGALVDVKHGNMLRAAQRLGLIKSTLGRAKSGRFFRNPKASLSPEDISSRWLELQYGWKPLIEDVYQAAKAYEALTSGPRTYYYKVSTKRRHHFDSSPAPSGYTCMSVGELKQKMLYEYREVLPNDEPRSLGLEDPTVVAWELVPYSFVVDWFIPIGTYISNAHAAPSMTGRWCKTTIREYSGELTAILNSAYLGATCDWERIIVERTAGTGGIYPPLPTFKSLDQALSPLHIVNALALVTSRLFGRTSYK
jgi:hypothetical protein